MLSEAYKDLTSEEYEWFHDHYKGNGEKKIEAKESQVSQQAGIREPLMNDGLKMSEERENQIQKKVWYGWYCVEYPSISDDRKWLSTFEDERS